MWGKRFEFIWTEMTYCVKVHCGEKAQLCCFSDSVGKGFDLQPMSVRWLQRAVSLGLIRRSVLTSEAKPLTSN